MLEKPKIGEPCNGCGICCQIQICRNGAFVLQLVSTLGETVKGPCPALVPKADGSFTCGIVLHPKKYIKHSHYPERILQKHFAVLIGANTGCDELGKEYDELEEEKLDAALEAYMQDKDFKKKAMLALKVVHGV